MLKPSWCVVVSKVLIKLDSIIGITTLNFFLSYEVLNVDQTFLIKSSSLYGINFKSVARDSENSLTSFALVYLPGYDKYITARLNNFDH